MADVRPPSQPPPPPSLLEAIERVALIGASPDDDDETRLRSSTLVIAGVVISILATAWVATYLALGLPRSAAIPAAYQAATIVGIVGLARTRSYRVFRFSQLGLMMVLPFVLQWSLGGFVASSVVCLWSLTAALSAVFFVGARDAIPWFVSFLVLLVVSALIDPLIAADAAAIPHEVGLLFFVLNVSGVAVTLYLLVQYFVLQRERALALSDGLLRNILPDSIAAQLKRAPGTIAQAHPAATVLFADVVDFTPYAERTAPSEVVGLLDEVFSRFDDLADRHGLEKIKTIGDAYMAVAGVPEPRPDHAQAVAEMALDMLREVEAMAGHGHPFQLRIGIDTGPVIAGVIGRRKFIYDLWGDTVNTAARMESQGSPGRIHVTAKVESALRADYLFRARGSLVVKGKGEMTTFFLEGRRPGRLAVDGGC